MEKRRVGFELPAEVVEQLLDELTYSDLINGDVTFWGLVQEYYQLSFIQGDTVICHPSFAEWIEKECGEDKPPWVFEQPSLKKMQCMILAGPGRGQVLLDTLKEIERVRDEGEEEVREEDKRRNSQIERMFQEE